jgi:hypothetical protein
MCWAEIKEGLVSRARADLSVVITRLCMCAPDGALSEFCKEDGRLECHERFMTLPRFSCYKLQQPSVRVTAPHSEGRRIQIVSVFVTGMPVTITVICDRVIHRKRLAM